MMEKGIKKKIGIMGGTFNPVHNGHLLLAESAREVFGLDEVLFMPSGNSYMKDARFILDGEIRAHMVSLAVNGNPFFSLSKMELEREGPTYTCETLKELKRQNGENQYFFIMGADNLLILEKWKDVPYILQNCVIAAAVRGDESKEKIREAAGRLMECYQADIRILPQRRIDISSFEIRKRRQEGKSIRYLLPESVFAYISENGLYGLPGKREEEK